MFFYMFIIREKINDYKFDYELNNFAFANSYYRNNDINFNWS